MQADFPVAQGVVCRHPSRAAALIVVVSTRLLLPWPVWADRGEEKRGRRMKSERRRKRGLGLRGGGRGGRRRWRRRRRAEEVEDKAGNEEEDEME